MAATRQNSEPELCIPWFFCPESQKTPKITKNRDFRVFWTPRAKLGGNQGTAKLAVRGEGDYVRGPGLLRLSAGLLAHTEALASQGLTGTS